MKNFNSIWNNSVYAKEAKTEEKSQPEVSSTEEKVVAVDKKNAPADEKKEHHHGGKHQKGDAAGEHKHHHKGTHGKHHKGQQAPVEPIKKSSIEGMDTEQLNNVEGDFENITAHGKLSKEGKIKYTKRLNWLKNHFNHLMKTKGDTTTTFADWIKTKEAVKYKIAYKKHFGFEGEDLNCSGADGNDEGGVNDSAVKKPATKPVIATAKPVAKPSKHKGLKTLGVIVLIGAGIFAAYKYFKN